MAAVRAPQPVSASSRGRSVLTQAADANTSADSGGSPLALSEAAYRELQAGSRRPAETRDFFVDLLGFEVAMDMGWVVPVASPSNPSVPK
jgi:hypothetical protein